MHSAKNWLLLGLALTTLGAAWLAWRQHGEIAALRATALPREERAALQKRAWDLEKANRDLKARLPASPAEKSDSGQSATAKPVPASRDSERTFDALLGLLAQPGVPAKVALLQQSAVESRYAALFKNLRLPPSQLEKLKALLTERTLSLQDVLTVARDQGIDPRDNPAALRQLIASAQNEINTSLKSLLGEQGFTQLAVYEQTLPQRGLVNELQQRLSYTEAPLTPTQAELLIQVLAANPAPRADTPTTAMPATRVGTALATLFSGGTGVGGAAPVFRVDASSGPAISPAVVAQSQGFLSAPQVAALQQLQQQQQAQQQLRLLLSEATNPNSAAVAPKAGKN
ncbi:MAG: hypothetical protein JNL39_17410 [Opitutaceae bacterium]|nr:hypothetical protein [Opitutaceae bacterium]